MSRLRDLWAGRLPLRDAVWTWGVLRGAPLNLVCALVALGIWQMYDAGPFAAGALVIHFLPTPYNILVAVGVWRSAAGRQHPHRTRLMARVFAVVLATLFVVI